MQEASRHTQRRQRRMISHRSRCHQPSALRRGYSACGLRPSAETCEAWRSWRRSPWLRSAWLSRGRLDMTPGTHRSSTHSSGSATLPSARLESQSLCTPVTHTQQQVSRPARHIIDHFEDGPPGNHLHWHRQQTLITANSIKPTQRTQNTIIYYLHTHVV